MNKVFCEVYQDGKLVNKWNNQLDCIIWLLGAFICKHENKHSYSINIKDGNIILVSSFTAFDGKQEFTTFKIVGLPLDDYNLLYNNKLYDMLRSELN